jgi:osmoprotectant transport system permease protein
MRFVRQLACALVAAMVSVAAMAAEPIVVGSKRFTESYVLGEIVCRSYVAAGTPCEHRAGLGNTGILEQALASGAVQVYPEYTGTIVRELLKRDGNPTLEELNAWLAARGLKAAVPLGFNNTYALAMREEQAAKLGIARISDLARPGAAALRLGLSHEFLVRADGWPGLVRAYGLALPAPQGVDHGIAYEALRDGQVDLIDVYSTDAKIGRYGLRVLQDDRAYFPAYDAVLLMKREVDDAPLRGLQGRIDARTMIALNAEVELDGRTFADVALRFLQQRAAGSQAVPPARPGVWQRLVAPDLARLTAQHLLLVGASLALAVAVAVPLGVWAWAVPRAAGWILGITGVVQTVPSLALLAFLISLLGTIGTLPALVALFVYALLPIVRNTHAGLAGVEAGLVDAARALALTPRQTLRLVLLPLAAPVILAGVKTAAVIGVGTATVAAFVGAGGYGERIVAGLAVNDHALMLAGALPAAVLALLVQWGFDVLERRSRPSTRRVRG